MQSCGSHQAWAVLTCTLSAEAFPSLGQMPEPQKKAASLRAPAVTNPSIAQEAQKGSLAGSAPKMGFANAVSGEQAKSH